MGGPTLDLSVHPTWKVASIQGYSSPSCVRTFFKSGFQIQALLWHVQVQPRNLSHVMSLQWSPTRRSSAFSNTYRPIGILDRSATYRRQCYKHASSSATAEQSPPKSGLPQVTINPSARIAAKAPSVA